MTTKKSKGGGFTAEEKKRWEQNLAARQAKPTRTFNWGAGRFSRFAPRKKEQRHA